MRRPTDSREILIAEALGDFKELLDRIDAVLPRLDESAEQMERASSALAGGLEPLQRRVAELMLTHESRAVATIERYAKQAALKTFDEQTRAMQESARAIFLQEVTPQLGRVARELRSAVNQGGSWWFPWLTHAVTAVVSVACSTMLLAALIEQNRPPAASPTVSVESPAVTPAPPPRERPRARK